MYAYDVSPENFTLALNAQTNRVAAQLTVFGQSSPITLGGLTGEETQGASAYVDDACYAARTVENQTGTNLALVSGGLVAAGLPEDVQQEIPEYAHARWGYFFGDIARDDALREHVHLAVWVAGEAAEAGNLPTTGSATYVGHVAGNVAADGAQYSAVGSFSNTWDFGARRGTVAMDFDQATYTGQTRLQDQSIVFEGALEAPNRIGSLHGNFIQGGQDPAAGVVGRFAITEAEGEAYRATGAFAAER